MMAFSPVDGYLYIGMGDGGSAGDPNNFAQNIDPLPAISTRSANSSALTWNQALFRNPADQSPFQRRAKRDLGHGAQESMEIFDRRGQVTPIGM
jgi:hypothetical protein